MRRLGLLLALLATLFAGCAPALTVTPFATDSLKPVFSPSPSATFAPSETLAPTLTATPDTRSSSLVETPTVTPLPTIPTFTPTFDVRTIVTATPAPNAVCPKEDYSLQPDFRIPIYPECFDNDSCSFTGSKDEILGYLNQGGSMSSVISRLGLVKTRKPEYFYRDVTGDSVPDLIYKDFTFFAASIHVIHCNRGKYEATSFDTSAFDMDVSSVNLETIEDLNRDGISEIIIRHSGCSGSGCTGLFVIEWNGNNFVDLGSDLWMWGVKNFQLADVDANGTKEILLTGDRPGSCCEGEMTPWRYKTIIYEWNGQQFTPVREQFTNPVYRFQVVQDADKSVSYGLYKSALLLYQEAVFGDQSKNWSREQHDYDVMPFRFPTPETPYPTPIPDPTEYPRLAAYAYYRMVILHTYLGEMEAAKVKYATLQEKFPVGNPGHPYVEMTINFWNAYQSSGKMYNACAAAIAYADAHPEILTPLGSDYHGAQSHIYVPADVCPFR